MFFKSPKKPALTNEQRVLFTAAGVEPALQRVNDLYLAGNYSAGDELLQPLIRACFSNLIGKPKYFPQVMQLGRFLIEHRKKELAGQLGKSLGQSADRYGPEELGAVQAYLNELLGVFAYEPGENGGASLMFYVCQQCGEPILRLTYPCDCCGFIVRDMDGITQGVALSSRFMAIDKLLSTSNEIRRVRRDGHGSFEFSDKIAQDKMQELVVTLMREASHLLDICKKHKGESFRTFDAEVLCSCGTKNRYDALAHGQRCSTCSQLLPGPGMRRYKVFLKDFVSWIVSTLDAAELVLYGNLIAVLVAIRSDAIFKDRRISAGEREEIVARLVGLKVLTSRNGDFAVHAGMAGVTCAYLPGAKNSDVSAKVMLRTAGYFNELYAYCRNGVPVV